MIANKPVRSGNEIEDQIKLEEKFLTLSEFRREVGIPLILAKKLIIWGEVSAVKAMDGTLQIAEADVLAVKNLVGNPWKKARLFLRALGPGLITGASDDDPSGIGTYSSVGAQFGLAILWMAAWLLPIMLAVQEACARIGIVTNKGLAGVLMKHYRKRFVGGLVVILIIANVMNIGADLGAMASALTMVSGIDFYLGAIIFAIFIIIVEIFVGYHLYSKVLKWLTISVVAYIVTGFMIHPDWLHIFKHAIIPRIILNKEFIFAMVAVFGTTITPYLFFWQTSEEVEECRLNGGYRKCFVRGRIGKMRTDVGTGMILANVVFFFIILTTAQVLFANGITEINSAEEAALALRPFGGQYAFLLFAIGIIGTGLLAVPILAGSGAYALAEMMKWKEGLDLKFSRAKGFYTVIAISIIVGLALNFIGINPIKALYYSAFLNGIISLPLLVAIMAIGNDKKIMGEETNPVWVNFFGWLAIIGMLALGVVAVFLFF
jgi:Mn2+/Fe2+ NRAMP family transporter